jgi:hypothetical protein
LIHAGKYLNESDHEHPFEAKIGFSKTIAVGKSISIICRMYDYDPDSIKYYKKIK